MSLNRSDGAALFNFVRVRTTCARASMTSVVEFSGEFPVPEKIELTATAVETFYECDADPTLWVQRHG